MPLKYVKKSLAYLGLDYVVKELPKGQCTQLWLIRDGFEHVNINAYETDTVVVQPFDDPAAIFVRQLLALRAMQLRRMGKILPN